MFGIIQSVSLKITKDENNTKFCIVRESGEEIRCS